MSLSDCKTVCKERQHYFESTTVTKWGRERRVVDVRERIRLAVNIFVGTVHLDKRECKCKHKSARVREKDEVV